MEEKKSPKNEVYSGGAPQSAANSRAKRAEFDSGGEASNWEELKKKLEECQKQKAEYLAGWQRARADLLNYKKEEMEKIGELIKYANEELILKILPILDNIYLAEKELPEDLKKHKWVEGILQIKNQVSEFLKQEGVEEIKTLGEKFDPNFHEVIKEIETKEKEAGITLEEIEKGYLINGRVLRPAKVKVTKYY